MDLRRAGDLLFLHARLAAHLRRPRGVADTSALRDTLEEVERSQQVDDLFEQAATLATALVRRMPFNAANAPLAVAAAVIWLREYDLAVDLPITEMDTVRRLLSPGDRAELAVWLRAHTWPRSATG